MRHLLFLLLGSVALSAEEPPPAGEDPLARLARVQAAWSHEGDLERRRALAQEVTEAALDLPWDDNADNEQKKLAALEEVATDGRLAGADLAVPDGAERIALTKLFTLPSAKEQPKPVIRRITPDRLEIWTPKHGWLFDPRGRIVAEAKPPRRDGVGREWFGAFLPDGRWITTDLWERDDTLYFFSLGGKLTREVKSARLLPAEAEEGVGLIGWARAAGDGKGWVVSVGSEGGRGCAWIGPAGAPRPLADFEPWALCQPRQLGARGYYIHRYLPSDDRKLVLDRHEAGHGPRVGFPHYSVRKTDASGETGGTTIAVIPDGDQFGFWPQSPRVFITADEAEAETGETIHPMTWFYDANGNFECRLPAWRVGDEGDRAMLFATDDRRVVTLNPDFQMTKTVRFALGDRVLAPRELFMDLRLGIFADGQRLILASWPK